ncbi:hypothetical protein CEE44_03945 [Candidatus Woesearchaeota archaeon B3_Woes]|nr:MAG: hypothetical protein CEE44_03945 [Candidatus Woesearchaeota archaeon B3_Woes]
MGNLMKKENKLVAIVGLTGSGKTIAANFFVEKGYRYLRFGQTVLDEVKKKTGLVSNPQLEQEIREQLREKHGMDALAKLNKKKIDKLLRKGNVVIDNLTSWSEYKFLRKTYNNFKVISIQASPEIRYKRLEERKEIDQKMINRPFSKQETKQRDYSEIENTEKAGPIAIADTTLTNETTKQDFLNKLEDLFSKKKKQRIGWDDYFMKMAFLAAERSTCLRRHVGAVIVKNKRVVATGYNSAVKGAKHCMEIGCLRDKLKIPSGTDKHICRAIHAEQNAIIQAALHGTNIEGSTIYMTHDTCPVCAKMIINSGIKEVISCSQRKESEFKQLFKETGVKFIKIEKPKGIEDFGYKGLR